MLKEELNELHMLIRDDEESQGGNTESKEVKMNKYIWEENG